MLKFPVGVLYAGLELQEFCFLTRYFELKEFLEAALSAPIVYSYEARWSKLWKDLLPSSQTFKAIHSAFLNWPVFSQQIAELHRELSFADGRTESRVGTGIYLVELRCVKT